MAGTKQKPRKKTRPKSKGKGGGSSGRKADVPPGQEGGVVPREVPPDPYVAEGDGKESMGKGKADVPPGHEGGVTGSDADCSDKVVMAPSDAVAGGVLPDGQGDEKGKRNMQAKEDCSTSRSGTGRCSDAKRGDHALSVSDRIECAIRGAIDTEIAKLVDSGNESGELEEKQLKKMRNLEESKEKLIMLMRLIPLLQDGSEDSEHADTSAPPDPIPQESKLEGEPAVRYKKLDTDWHFTPPKSTNKDYHTLTAFAEKQEAMQVFERYLEE